MTTKSTQVPQLPQRPSWDWNQDSAVRRQQINCLSYNTNIPTYAFSEPRVEVMFHMILTTNSDYADYAATQY
jgi:hypothetical protein